MQEQSAETAGRLTLKASVFGELRLMTADGRPLTLHNQRATLILAILCLQPEDSIKRAVLAKLLWPDRFAAQAKASLRQCLLDLRKSLEEHGLQGLRVTRAEVAMEPGTLVSDLSAFEFALEDAPETASDHLLAIGNQALLQSITLNPELAAWLAARREHVDTRMKALIAKALGTMNGGQGKALLDAARLRFPGLQVALPRTEGINLAVLPFSQIDEVGGAFFLADAIVDEFSSRLGRIDGLKLVGRTSIAAVMEKGGALPQIAQELGVSYLIEGEVRRKHEVTEVRIALIEGQSGTEVWSRRITGSIDEFLETRSLVGSNIIAAISRALAIDAAPGPTRPMTGNREAYALYLQGRSLGQRIGGDGALPKAIELLKHALEIDPRFAECWTALADAHIMIAAITPTLERKAHTEKGAKCAHQALQLDLSQAHAYSVLGVAEWCEFNPAKALDLAYEAYERNPNDADVSSRLGSTLLYLGKSQEALPFVQVAVDRDPVNPRNYVMLSSAYLNVGDIAKARNAAQSVIDLGGPRMWLAIAQYIEGDFENAVQSHYDNRFFLGNTIMRPPGMPPMDDTARDAYFDIAARGIFSGKADERAAYCQMLGGLHATMPDPHDSSIILPALWMGHAELVMKIYSECIHPANIWGLMNLWIDADPYNRTRLHPNFMNFADKVGMTEAWNRHGWPDLMPADPRIA
ncbi:MAG: hypothetical protein AAF251_09765 [Pseudomonadota bacterium]